MSSPPPQGAEMSPGSAVVAAKSPQTGHADMRRRRRRRETPQSPFKVPDSNSIFLQSVNEKEDRKEETQKFLALPIDEKTAHAARMKAKLRKELEGEEEEETKSLKQGGTLQPQQTGRHELKMAMMKRENLTKESKHDLISMQRQKAVLELSLMTKRSEMSRMDEALAKEEAQLRELEKILETDNLNFEAFLRENEKKSVEARTLFEREAKSKQEKNVEIKKRTAEIGTIKRELAKFEEILIDYKRYKELLLELSPPEWQEAQRSKASKAEVLSDPEESAVRNGLESKVSGPGEELPSIRETRISSARSDTQTSKLDSDNSEYEDEPALYFTDPQQLLELLTELTEQNLSLIQNTTRVEETLEELRQSTEKTSKKIEKDEEQITLQITDLNQRIAAEKARGTKLRQTVQLHDSLKTADQDAMLDALAEKVVEVHRCCVDDRVTNLSTLERLTGIENHMALLLQGLESMPEGSLKIMKKIKDSERRSRQREEKLREQREKQKERMRKYMERSLANSKKVCARKLMPRCKPVGPQVRVRNVDDTSAEDELYAYLFGSEDFE